MSVRKRGKSWQASWSNRNGKRVTKTFRTKADACAFEREQRDLARKGELFDPTAAKQPLGALFEPWMLTKQHLKPVTLLGYQSAWLSVVLPRWGSTPIGSITYSEVKSWLANCASESGKILGSSRTRAAYQVLAMMLDFAVESGYLVKNPARGIPGAKGNHLPKVQLGDSRNILQREELRAVALACGEFSDLIMLMGTVGLRFNEAVSLKGGDVDFELGQITVQRTFSDVNGKIIEQSPKNGTSRVVPLPETLRASLLARKLGAGAEGYLWSTSVGTPIRNSNFSRRVWGPALREAGISRRVTLHDLRHTAASWLVQNGCNVAHLASMLGHSDPALTLRRYTHLFTDDFERISRIINQAETA